MKKSAIKYFYCLILTGSITPSVQSQHEDGPYVFYNHDTVAIRSIVNKEGKPALSEQIILNNKRDIHITISPFDTIRNGFELGLHPRLQIEPCVFKKPEKLFVLSDIEGEFAVFKSLLIGNGVMNENYGWTFGGGHLVICGDLFDRGKQVVEYLWLLYKLEEEAKAKRGYVHVILGNHDIMNISGDFRYVQPKYFETASTMGVNYKDLYAGNTELGRWLRTKNIIEKIGNILFLHAGVAPEINRMGISARAINDSCRPYYASAPQELPLTVYSLFGKDVSPFWYRGYFKIPKATESQVDSSLSLFACKQIIVGHTILNDITQLYNGKVIGVNVNVHVGNSQALLIEGDKYYRVGPNGDKLKLVIEGQ